MIRVTVWNENRFQSNASKIHEVYPEGIHGMLASIFKNAGFEVRTALLDDPENGLPEEVLAQTDVLVYWSHIAQNDLTDETCERICRHVNCGMGFIPLHSAHMSKPLRQLMGTTCTLDWRENKDHEILWCTNIGHPIASGVDPHFSLEREEMYREYFDIPQPEELVFIGWFSSGEVFRSGVCYRRGRGRIFYFQPGHETYPTFYNANIQKILVNAVKWACPEQRDMEARTCRHVPPVIQ